MRHSVYEQLERDRIAAGRASLDAERKRSALLGLGADVAALKMQLALIRLDRALQRKYRPDQPRVPAGNPDGGQWISDLSRDITRIGRRPNGGGSGRVRVAQADFGSLVAEMPIPGGGRYCVYRFDFGDVIVQGPTNFSCQKSVHPSAVRHGQLLNDNRP